jgi:hypothetical protein
MKKGASDMTVTDLKPLDKNNNADQCTTYRAESTNNMHPRGPITSNKARQQKVLNGNANKVTFFT